MESISATASTADRREPSRRLQIARRFLANRVATAALFVLLLIVLMSIFAPWIVPQNPYDLNAIDLADARLPPGHVKMSKQSQTAVQLAFDASGTAGTALQVSRVEREDFAPLNALKIAVEPVPGSSSAERSWRLVVTPEAGGRLDPFVSARISGLPRTAALSAGERPRFGDIWTLGAADLQGLRLSLPAEVQSVNLRLELTGGIERPLLRYWLGTDDQGRDLLSAIIMGLRISMVVAIISVLIALSLGTILGLIAAYRGGRTDALIMRLVDLQVSFPTILVALILLALIGSGIGNVIVKGILVSSRILEVTETGTEELTTELSLMSRS
jgi:peptide/nickel transport system permease protein